MHVGQEVSIGDASMTRHAALFAKTDAHAKRELVISDLYARHVNEPWVRLLSMLDMDVRFTQSVGARLRTSDGQEYLDFLSGYGVYNVGHHHPRVVAALVEELHGSRPTMLQSEVPELASILAERLSKLAGGGLDKVYFTNTGSEGIETVIKFARAHTKRDTILYAAGGFHGLTCGALSLMSNPWWRDGFGPLLPDTHPVPFGDLNALEEALKSSRVAAFVTEPIQAEAGVRVPPADYLREAAALCKKHGALFVLDEVQTGMYRTGTFLAAHQFDVEPDMVVMAKAMSGGFVPVGAVLMTDAICDSVYSSVARSFIHASTFGENSLAMRACLATLDVIHDEGLGARAVILGERFRAGVNALVRESQLLKECRGVGSMNGIELQAPSSLTQRLLWSSFEKLHPGLFGQMCVKSLFHDGRVLVQMCGHDHKVIKAIPPLVASEAQIDQFIQAFARLLETIETEKARFWGQGLAIGRKAVGW
jgi:ornithine--oxo-acid transaminase